VSAASSRKGARRQRSLIISVVAVVVITFGSLLGVLLANWSPRLGLDLAGGLEVVYAPAKHVSPSELNETVDILSNRVNGLGVSGAQVSTQGQQIVVQVPGITDGQQSSNRSARPPSCSSGPSTATPRLRRPQGLDHHCAPDPAVELPVGLPARDIEPDRQHVVVDGGELPDRPYPGLATYPSTPDKPAGEVLLPGLAGEGTQRYLMGPSELTGRAVKTASAQLSQTGQWVVNITLTDAGSAGWDAMTQKYFHEIIGIELDGVVQSAPITQPSQTTWSSFDGQVEISGSFTQTSAQNLAIALQYGSLPVKLDRLTATVVSPTLGKSSLLAGLAAGIAGSSWCCSTRSSTTGCWAWSS